MNIVLFDPEIDGHHLEYLHHITRYVQSHNGTDIAGFDPDARLNIYFIVHPNIETVDPDLCNQIRHGDRHLVLRPLSREEYEQMESGGVLSTSWRRWAVLEKYADEFNAHHCVLMEMNAYQPVLGALRARRVSFSISGILFFPFVRIEPEREDVLAQGQACVERCRKDIQLRWVLSNTKVDRLFVLNDQWAAQALNARYGTDVFSALPDPVPKLDEKHTTKRGSVSAPPGDPGAWSGNRVHFLLFGSLRREKGIVPFLKSAERLSEAEARRITIHLLGKTREDLRDNLPDLVRRLRKDQPNLCIHFEDRFLPDSELDAALRSTDVVVAPYLRTEGSSGVIGHAARYERPILGPDTGLVGTLIQEYDLGLTVDTSSPEELCNGLRECLQIVSHNNEESFGSPVGMRRYVSERTPEAFAKKLLTTIVQ